MNTPLRLDEFTDLRVKRAEHEISRTRICKEITKVERRLFQALMDEL
jgi:hypothetical protein